MKPRKTRKTRKKDKKSQVEVSPNGQLSLLFLSFFVFFVSFVVSLFATPGPGDARHYHESRHGQDPGQRGRLGSALPRRGGVFVGSLYRILIGRRAEVHVIGPRP